MKKKYDPFDDPSRDRYGNSFTGNLVIFVALGIVVVASLIFVVCATYPVFTYPSVPYYPPTH